MVPLVAYRYATRVRLTLGDFTRYYVKRRRASVRERGGEGREEKKKRATAISKARYPNRSQPRLVIYDRADLAERVRNTRRFTAH